MGPLEILLTIRFTRDGQMRAKLSSVGSLPFDELDAVEGRAHSRSKEGREGREMIRQKPWYVTRPPSAMSTLGPIVICSVLSNPTILRHGLVLQRHIAGKDVYQKSMQWFYAM